MKLLRRAVHLVIADQTRKLQGPVADRRPKHPGLGRGQKAGWIKLPDWLAPASRPEGVHACQHWQWVIPSSCAYRI